MGKYSNENVEFKLKAQQLSTEFTIDSTKPQFKYDEFVHGPEKVPYSESFEGKFYLNVGIFKFNHSMSKLYSPPYKWPPKHETYYSNLGKTNF